MQLCMCLFFSSYSLNMESEIEEKDLTDDILMNCRLILVVLPFEGMYFLGLIVLQYLGVSNSYQKLGLTSSSFMKW